MPLKLVYSEAEELLRSVDKSPGVVLARVRLDEELEDGETRVFKFVVSPTFDPATPGDKVVGDALMVAEEESRFMSIREAVEAAADFRAQQMLYGLACGAMKHAYEVWSADPLGTTVCLLHMAAEFTHEVFHTIGDVHREADA